MKIKIVTAIVAVFYLINSLPQVSFAQSVDVKDDADNTLLQINDEGTTGSISLPSLSSISSSTSKLYNLSGSLYWNGTLVGLGGAAEINDLSDAKYDVSSLFLGEHSGNDNDDTVYDNGNENVGVGFKALFKNTSGFSNTAIGYNALYYNTTGKYNTANGYQALLFTTGSYNTGTGSKALRHNTDGSYNTAYGYNSLNLNTTGSNNTANGYYALYNNKTGTNNTAIGYDAGPGSDNLTNTTAIGNGATTTASNQVIIGNSSVTSIGGYAAWSNLSDGRYKRNIKEDVAGINFIMGLRPITYNLDVDLLSSNLKEDFKIDENGTKADKEPSTAAIASRSKKAGKRNTGFIAQEVEELAEKLGFDFSGVEVPENENAMYSLRYAEFVVPIVKGMQEQQKMIKEQQKMNKEQQRMNKEQQIVIKELKEEMIQLKRELGSRNFTKASN